MLPALQEALHRVYLMRGYTLALPHEPWEENVPRCLIVSRVSNAAYIFHQNLEPASRSRWPAWPEHTARLRSPDEATLHVRTTRISSVMHNEELLRHMAIGATTALP